MASKINVDKIARGSGTPEFTIPTADGAADTFLKTDGSGVLSFDTVTTTALTGSTNTWIPTITGANALTGTANFTYDGNTLDVKNSGTASSINLYCETGNAHYTKIKSGPHSGATSYTITLPNVPPTVSGQFLSATTAGVASWSTVTQGIGTASQWKVDSSIDTVDGENVFSGTWSEVDRVGSAMTVSSGVFTFPSTGIWNIVANLSANRSSASPYWQFRIYTTTNDGGAWTLSYNSSEGFYGSDGYANSTNAYTFDVIDTANYKVRFACELTSDNGIATTNPNSPTAIFSRWGDT